jgi:acyl-CoA thioester hydrolase
MPGTTSVFEKRIDIRWRDLDAYGHVNNAVYLTYAEEVIDAWIRETLSLPPGTVWDYVTARAALDYRSELRQTDLAAVGTVTLARLGTKSVTTSIELRTPDGRLAAEIEIVAVAIDREHGGSRVLTATERAAFADL